jgi:hypothetical protein
MNHNPLALGDKRVKLSSIILARTLCRIETFDLNPKGRVFYPELVEALVQRYKFQKFPKTLEEFNEQKGVEFYEGKFGNKVIQKFTIYNTLLVIETRSSTDDSKQILEEMLSWAAAKFDLNYKPEMIEHFGYVSGVTFYSDAPILGGSTALKKIAKATGDAVSEIWHERFDYETINIVIGHDPLVRKYGIASFTLTRRAEAKFLENKYYSEAPLPTDLHLKLLEQYEQDVLSPMGANIRQLS